MKRCFQIEQEEEEEREVYSFSTIPQTKIEFVENKFVFARACVFQLWGEERKGDETKQ